MFFEAAIFAAPVWLVWNLQTDAQMKVEVVIPFALRFMCVHLLSLAIADHNGLKDTEPLQKSTC